jgi:hypothetical protein
MKHNDCCENCCNLTSFDYIYICQFKNDVIMDLVNCCEGYEDCKASD